MMRCLSCGMPMPVSFTTNAMPSGPTALGRLCSALAGHTVIDTPPRSVNLIAFDSRLRRICRSRMSSVSMVSGSAVARAPIVKLEVLLLGHVAERALDVVAKAPTAAPASVDHHRARLDLGQIEDLVDQREQVGARLVDVSARSASACRSGSRRRCPTSWRDRISRLLSGVRSSCDMLARNCALVARGERQLLGLLLQLLLGESRPRGSCARPRPSAR